MKNKNCNINFTGERMINHEKSDMFLAHKKRYDFALRSCHSKRVLDISCGSGYGSYLVSAVAINVIGADIDPDTIKFGSEKYRKNNLEFKNFDGLLLDASLIGKFDVVISFETIEHISKYDLFLSNIYKYLNKGGLLILSTPNNYRHIHPPENKFHSQEFDIKETIDVLKRNGFDSFYIYGQCFTDIKKGDSLIYRKNLKYLLANFIKKGYRVLNKIGIISKIDHLNIYKAVGNLQRNYTRDFEIKPIDINSEFYNPETTVIKCKKYD